MSLASVGPAKEEDAGLM